MITGDNPLTARAIAEGSDGGRAAGMKGQDMGRDRPRVYLGATPGVGKTMTMLEQGHRRAGRGTDVVVGYAETHNRPRTAEKLAGLEMVPRKQMSYRGSTLTELDADAVRDRKPQVALVDELAHTNVPGSPREKRWQDVELLLEAGIDVISTVNVQHLESVGLAGASMASLASQRVLAESLGGRYQSVAGHESGVRPAGSAHGATVELRAIDRGPGIPESGVSGRSPRSSAREDLSDASPLTPAGVISEAGA